MSEWVPVTERLPTHAESEHDLELRCDNDEYKGAYDIDNNIWLIDMGTFWDIVDTPDAWRPIAAQEPTQ